MLPLVIFDDGTGALAPLADLRPVFDIRTGAFTTIERLECAVGSRASALICPDDVAPLIENGSGVLINELPDAEELLLVSARCALPPEGLADLKVGAAMVESASGDVVAARLLQVDAQYFLDRLKLPESALIRETPDRCLLAHPEDVIRFRDAALRFDLDAIVRKAPANASQHPGVTILGESPVLIDDDATVLPTVVLDAAQGPIVIAAGALVRPRVIIVGPAYIGPGATILDGALIKANTSIGPQCKVAGEVGGTIFQGFSNKSHDGHLGDSWIGQWVNLGAGATNSNLLNTYGEVSIRSAADEPRRRTELTFLGAIIGDHVKIAIGTRIMTGSVFGLGAMIASAAPPPTFIERFTWLTDDGAQWYRFEKFIAVARTVMARRDIEPAEAYINQLQRLHRAAAPHV